MTQSRTQKLRSTCSLLLAVFVSTALCGCDFGVQGGAGALTTKFGGLDKAEAISPTSVTLTWTPQAGYTGYTVYSSSQDHPIITLPTGSSYTINGLNSNTSYSFSVVGTAPDKSQYGTSKPKQATTWSNFLGPTSASVVDSQSVAVAWNYNLGPNFQVYYAASGAPTITAGVPPKLTAAQFVTSSPAGYTVGGLSPNTTYYFMAVAKYSDGTDSYQNSQAASTTITSQFLTPGNLGTLPVITTASNTVTSLPPVFTVSNSLNTYTTSFALALVGGGTSALGSITGNGNLTAIRTLPAGVQSVLATTLDSFSGSAAVSEFSIINVVTALPNNGLKVVSATTPSSLNPLPTVSNNPISLGPFPVFTITNSQPSYTTTIYNPLTTPATPLGSITGNGLIKTATSAPLPQGPNTLYAIVTSNGQTATINNLQVRIKSVDSAIITPPAAVNGGIGTQGFGRNMVVGDFNCDGRPDLAVGAPYGNGVYVYYGTTTGLDFSATPSLTPLAGTTKPLFITNPSNWAGGYAIYTQVIGLDYAKDPSFGVTLATGNFNGDFNLTTSKPCSDLAISASGALGDSNNAGVIAVFYGSPTGIQTGPLQENTFTCLGAGSSSCAPAFYRYWTTGITMGTSTPLIHYSYEGMGYALAVGDLDGDGYDDMVGSTPYADPTTNYGKTGMFLLWRGGSNGLSPNFTKIFPPADLMPTAGVSNLYFGRQLAIGHFVTSPRGSFPQGPSNPPVGPADLAISFSVLDSATVGLSQPASQSGVIIVPGQTTTPFVKVDPVTFKVNSYFRIFPPNCNTAGPVALPAGWTLGSASCANAPNSMTALDLNGDGWDDLVFSDPFVTTPGGTRGAVYIYYGSANPADFINQGSQSTIPSPNNTCPDTVTGKCDKPQVIYRNDAGLDYFGSSVFALGDTNGDGYPELGVGASLSTVSAATNSGLAFIYRGSANGLMNTLSTKITPNKTKNALFGTSLAGAKFSSVTGFADLYTNVPPTALTHTFNDLAIGAIGESPANRVPGQAIAAATGTGALGSNAQGTVSLYSNASPGFALNISTPTTVLAPTNVIPTNMLSDEAMLVGDINRDGFSDAMIKVSVPAPFVKKTVQTTLPIIISAAQIGFVIYYGSPNGFVTTRTTAGVTDLIPPSYNPISPTDPMFVSNTSISGAGFNNMTFAATCGPAGDMNGDGFADVFASDFFAGGTAVVFYGSSTGLIVSPSPRAIVYGPGTRPSLDPTLFSTTGYYTMAGGQTVNAQFGTWMTYGDFNGDHFSDLAFMGYYGDITVFYGSQWGVVSEGHAWVIDYPAQYAAATVGDRADTVSNCVSQPFGASGPNQVCYPLIIRTGGVPGAVPVPIPANPGVCGIMSAGDMDGDGTDDLVSVNCRDSTWNNGAGTVSIYYGSYTRGINPFVFVNLRLAIYTPTPFGAYPNSRFLGGPDTAWTPAFSGGFGKGYDINGDGLADIVLTSMAESTGYVIYGVPGPGSPTQNSGAYILQGYCASYPCYLNVNNVATPDYAANHITDVTVANPNSCSPALRSCNVERFVLPDTYAFALDGITGTDDLTGDIYGDVILSRTLNKVNNIAGMGKFYLYSGSANGLKVIGTPSTQPNCIAGICDPTLLTMPLTLPQMSAPNTAMNWYSMSWQNPQDVDGDGKRDLLISSPKLNATDLNGNLVGTSTGGFFLFH